MKAQLARGAIGGVIAITGAMIAMSLSFSWTVLVSGAGLASLVPAALAFAVAGVIVFTGEVSALRAAMATLAGHVVAIPVALPVAVLFNPLTRTVLPGTFAYVVAGVTIAALLCGGRLSLLVVGLAIAIVAASTLVPAQGGDLGWWIWFALVVAAWTILPIAARRASSSHVPVMTDRSGEGVS
jgi:hypothetical protein